MLQSQIDKALTIAGQNAFEKLVQFKADRLAKIDKVFGESTINNGLAELEILFTEELAQ